jgi:hypothetical protein
MTACHDIRPLLPARADELTLSEIRIRAEHVATCTRCAAEAAAYTRLGHALSAMASLEVDPADGSLERILVAIGRRRTGVTGPRVLAAAGASGALVATVVVARAVHHRRQVQRHQVLRSTRRPGVGRLRLPSLPVPTPALARAK